MSWATARGSQGPSSSDPTSSFGSADPQASSRRARARLSSSPIVLTLARPQMNLFIPATVVPLRPDALNLTLCSVSPPMAGARQHRPMAHHSVPRAPAAPGLRAADAAPPAALWAQPGGRAHRRRREGGWDGDGVVECGRVRKDALGERGQQASRAETPFIILARSPPAAGPLRLAPSLSSPISSHNPDVNPNPNPNLNPNPD